MIPAGLRSAERRCASDGICGVLLPTHNRRRDQGRSATVGRRAVWAGEPPCSAMQRHCSPLRARTTTRREQWLDPLPLAAALQPAQLRPAHFRHIIFAPVSIRRHARPTRQHHDSRSGLATLAHRYRSCRSHLTQPMRRRSSEQLVIKVAAVSDLGCQRPAPTQLESCSRAR